MGRRKNIRGREKKKDKGRYKKERMIRKKGRGVRETVNKKGRGRTYHVTH